MSDAGRFIVLEGGEGVGKTTQAALLSSWFDGLGIDHVVAREPGGTPVGEAVREVLLHRADLDMPALSELFLLLAARSAFVQDVVRPALAAGRWVVADRFSLSTLAYQGCARGLPLEDVRRAVRLATGGLEPDLYLVLDLPGDVSADRLAGRGGTPDRMEAEGPDFLNRVRQAYLDLSGVEPHARVVSAVGPPDRVHRRIRDELRRSFPRTFGGEDDRGAGAADGRREKEIE